MPASRRNAGTAGRGTARRRCRRGRRSTPDAGAPVATRVHRRPDELHGCGRPGECRDDETEEHVGADVRGDEEAVVGVQRARGRDHEAHDGDARRDRAPDGPGLPATTQPDHPCHVRRGEQDGCHEPEEVDVPRGQPAPRAWSVRERIVREELGRCRVGRLAQCDLVRRGGGPAECRGEPGCDAHDRELRHDEHPERTTAPGPSGQRTDRPLPLDRTDDPHRDDGRDLDEHEDAVRCEQVRERTDTDLRRRRPGDRDEHEAPERDARVPADDERQTVAVEDRTDEDDHHESADPQRGADEVQPERGDRGVVTRGAGGVPLLRERDETDHRDAGGEGDHAPPAHGEAEHRHGGGDEDGDEPGEPEVRAGEEHPHRLPELLVERDLRPRDAEEREERRDDARHGPETAAAAATSIARSHSGAVRESPIVVRASPPMVAAAARSTTTRAIGRPKRTTAPGSAMSAGFAPPPITSATNREKNAASSSTAGPMERAIRFTRQA